MKISKFSTFKKEQVPRKLFAEIRYLKLSISNVICQEYHEDVFENLRYTYFMMETKISAKMNNITL